MKLPDDTSDSVHRRTMLVAAFLAWMFAGLENSLFILIHRQMMLDLLGPGTSETIVAEWLAWFQSAFLFGAAAGGWLFGWLGDRFGRTLAMGWSVICYSGMAMVCWFIDDPHLMWIARFLACLGFGGSWPNAVALVAEAWPSASRPLMAGVMGSAANFGFVLLGIVCYIFPVTTDQWRWTLLVGASPLIIGIWILLTVPESAKWLATRTANDGAGPRAAPVAEVFRQPLLYRTLLGISLGAIPVVGTAANANWVVPWTDQFESRAVITGNPETPGAAAVKSTKPDPRRKSVTQILRSTGAIFGSLLGGILASFLGRRVTYFLISLSTFAVSSVIFSQLNPHHQLFPYLTFLLGFCGVTYFGWLPLFLPELFPTRVRSTGTGISFNTGRVIAAFIVLGVAFRMSSFEGDYAKVGLWSGMIYVVGMVIIWFAAEEVGRLTGGVQMKPVGLIGLGLLGTALSERLKLAGHHVIGFDISPDRRDALAMIGEPAETAAAVAERCQHLILSLPDSHVVSAVLSEINERLSGHLIIDTTTGSPSDSAMVGKSLSSRGIEYLDATISGSSEQARRGEVVVLAGGTAAAFEAAMPLFQCFSSRQFHTGTWGTGSTAKLIVNLVLGLNRAALAEALNFARECGLNLDRILEILRSGAAYSRVMDMKGEKMIRHDFDPQARLDQHWKDVRLILELAGQTGSAVPLSRLHSSLLEQASQLGCGQLDNSAIIRVFEATHERQ